MGQTVRIRQLYLQKLLKFSNDIPNWQKAGIVIGSILGLSLLTSQMSYKEISWKEFYADYLEKNDVERIEVFDNHWVRVVPRHPTSVNQTDS
jgi:hypothetical protein